MRQLLINTVEPGEVRIALLEDGRVIDYHLEEAVERSIHGNIYLGRVVNIEPGIQAAFIEIGESKSAFLHVSDLHHAYQHARDIPFDRLAERPPELRVLIQDILRRGQTLLVQVTKDPIGHKGPSVTTFISLPGRFLVLMAGMARSGVSKKIEDPQLREQLRELADSLKVEDDATGVIVRTAGADQPRKELEKDLRYLRQVWAGIRDLVDGSQPPKLVYEESDLVIRTIRDLFTSDVKQILVDSEAVAGQVVEFLKRTMPRYAARVEVYTGATPLFYEYQVERQIDEIYDRKINLPSGGSLVIDETEALVAIDVNSGRYRQEKDLEQTALAINLEAAGEIARQLRLRDIGGVVVCDFIDMTEAKNRRQVETALREHLRLDRAKTWFAKMSRFGIVEMTRQRMRPSKEKVARQTCPTCAGRGTIRSSRNVLSAIFRELRRGLGEQRHRLGTVTTGPAILDQLYNESRERVSAVEAEFGKAVRLQLDSVMNGQEYRVEFS
ncbi:MAG: ribonuclease E/G [Planctomycetota bacterium]